MRVRITFKVKNRGASIPFHHQHIIAAVIKKLFSETNQVDLLESSHYTFSGVKGLTRVSRKGLHFHSRRVSVVFSSTNQEFTRTLVNLFLSESEIKFGELLVSPETVDQELLQGFSNESRLICISPLIPQLVTDLEEDTKHFIDPNSNEFSDMVFESTAERMEESGFDTDSITDFHKFQIVPDKEYLQKILNSNKKFSRIYNLYELGSKIQVRGYTFPFQLYAPPEVQEFIFLCGLGQYGNHGFGMVDFANQNPIERTVPYETDSSISA